MSLEHRVRNSEAWRHFTLLDVLLIQASFALSFSLAYSVGPADREGVERIVAGAVWGVVLAGPMVLATQWTVRNRSRSLSAGEWLWLSPIALFALLWLCLKGPAAGYPELSRHLISIWWFAQFTCIGVAVATGFSNLRGYRGTVPCYWTDRVGTAAALLFGLWVLLCVLPFAG